MPPFASKGGRVSEEASSSTEPVYSLNAAWRCFGRSISVPSQASFSAKWMSSKFAQTCRSSTVFETLEDLRCKQLPFTRLGVRHYNFSSRRPTSSQPSYKEPSASYSRFGEISRAGLCLTVNRGGNQPNAVLGTGSGCSKHDGSIRLLVNPKSTTRN